MHERTCEECGTAFVAKTNRKRYCTDRCWWRVKARRNYAAKGIVYRTTCEVADCETPHLARGFCARHYKAWRRAQGIIDPSGGGRRHVQRAKRYGVPWERFDPIEVFDRDGWFCGICGTSVDRALSWPDPMSVSLDHVVPLVQGGGHLRGNAQCSHYQCNTRKARGPRASRVTA